MTGTPWSPSAAAPASRNTHPVRAAPLTSRPEQCERRCYPARMLLWLLVAFILLSASAVLYLTYGPLRTASNVQLLRGIAAVQYAAALVLIAARLTGRA